MNCPKCNKKMQIKKDDFSIGVGNKQYKRTSYWCKEDDIWVVVEMPVEENLA